MTIPSVAAAETAVIEATVTRAGKRATVAALTLDVAPAGGSSSVEANTSNSSFEVELGRRAKTPNVVWLDVKLNRKRGERFKLKTSRALKPNRRSVIGAFRKASGELLEVAVTLRP